MITVHTASGGDGPRMLMYQCPACDEVHGVPIDGPVIPNRGPWRWNGDRERPTLDPSVRVWIDGEDAPNRRQCHHVLTNGVLTFQGDSWKLPGESRPLPEWD